MGEECKWRNAMSIYPETKDLLNTQQLNVQQMEVAVNGPDGATHLILCTGMAELSCANHEVYAFFVGPQISRRQFVGAIASGALSSIQSYEKSFTDDHVVLKANLISIGANYDDEAGQVKVRAEISSGKAMMKLGISYNVSILAEMPIM
jgi:hypothetical protein